MQVFAVPDQTDKTKPKEVSTEPKIEQDASRVASGQAHAETPEHLRQAQKEKSTFEEAGLIPVARGPVSGIFGRPEISEEIEGEKILHVAQVDDKIPRRADRHPSYTQGLEAARQKAWTPEEAAQLEVEFTERYIEHKLRESGKDPAELLKAYKHDPDDPHHAGTSMGGNEI